MAQSDVAQNAIRLVTESVITGGSRFLDGNVKSGITHFATGLVAGAVFGPLGVLAVKLDSFSRSARGRSLFQLADNPSPQVDNSTRGSEPSSRSAQMPTTSSSAQISLTTRSGQGSL